MYTSSGRKVPNLNIAVLGGTGVGKTSICNQFTERRTPGTYRPTIEEKYDCTFTLDPRRIYNLSIVDTQGQEFDSKIPQNLLINVQAYIVCFSLSHYESFVLADRLLADLMENMDFDHSTVPIILVGNKTDIPKPDIIQGQRYMTDNPTLTQYQYFQENMRPSAMIQEFYIPELHSVFRQVRQEDGYALARKYQIEYKETSAKSYTDIVNVFAAIALHRDRIHDQLKRDYMRRYKEEQANAQNNSPARRRKNIEQRLLKCQNKIQQIEDDFKAGNITEAQYETAKNEEELNIQKLRKRNQSMTNSESSKGDAEQTTPKISESAPCSDNQRSSAQETKIKSRNANKDSHHQHDHRQQQQPPPKQQQQASTPQTPLQHCCRAAVEQQHQQEQPQQTPRHQHVDHRSQPENIQSCGSPMQRTQTTASSSRTSTILRRSRSASFNILNFFKQIPERLMGSVGSS